MVSLCMASLYLKHHYTVLKLLTFFKCLFDSFTWGSHHWCLDKQHCAVYICRRTFFRLWLFSDLGQRCLNFCVLMCFDELIVVAYLNWKRVFRDCFLHDTWQTDSIRWSGIRRTFRKWLLCLISGWCMQVLLWLHCTLIWLFWSLFCSYFVCS